MNLCSMTMSAINENKISATDAIKMITEEVEEHSDEISGKLYEKIYKKAYGNTISKELAEHVIRQMAVTDGSERADGMMWTLEQAVTLGNEMGIDWTKIPKNNFWVVLNMARSDSYNLAKKMGYEDDAKFYGYYAKDWLTDVDAHPDKLYRYIFRVIM